MATVTFSADGVQVTNRLSVLKEWLISGEQPEPGVTDISDYGDLFIPSCYEEGDIPVWAMYANKFYPATIILEPGTFFSNAKYTLKIYSSSWSNSPSIVRYEC